MDLLNDKNRHVKAIVTGACGRMGARIINLVRESQGIELGGAVERRGHPRIGWDVGECIGLGRIGVTIQDDLGSCISQGDVIIDFTSHEASMIHIEFAASTGKPIVVGTTGFTSEELEKVKQLSGKLRCVMAPNMSVGVNVLLKVLSDVASILGQDYDIEIVEAHHRFKKDAPSGTALQMAKVIADRLGLDMKTVATYCRQGFVGERKRNEIGIQTVRAGDIVGDHTVIFGGVGERLEFTHRAHSRDNFALGAIRAAMWIVKQEIGLYDMQDVLGLRCK